LLSSILSALQTQLLTIPDLTVDTFSPQQITPPHAMLGIPDVPTYRSTMGRGYYEPAFTVTLFASTADAQYGQDLLLSFAEVSGTNSIPACIEADRSLGDTVADCIVQSFQSLGLESVGGLDYYAGQFTLVCIAKGG
jgi:hypothetical protein